MCMQGLNDEVSTIHRERNINNAIRTIRNETNLKHLIKYDILPARQTYTVRYIRYGFLLVFCSDFIPIVHCFWDVQFRKKCRDLENPDQRSLRVVGTDTDRSATHDFTLTFHSNHGPTSHHFQDKRRFQSKIANISHPLVFCTPAEEVTLELGIGAWG